MRLYDGANEWATSKWSTFDERQAATSQMNDRQSGRRGAGTAVSGATFDEGNFWGYGKQSYSVVGINAGEVGNMRAAINTYVTNIKNYLSQIETSTSANNAFRNEDVQAAMQAYIEKVKEYCMNLVSQLLAFSDKLQDVADQWQANMAELAGNVNDSASAINAGTTYTEQK